MQDLVDKVYSDSIIKKLIGMDTPDISLPIVSEGTYSNYVYSEKRIKLIINQLKKANSVFNLEELDRSKEDMQLCLSKAGHQIRELLDCLEILEAISDIAGDSPLDKVEKVLAHVKGIFKDDFEYMNWVEEKISPDQIKKLEQFKQAPQDRETRLAEFANTNAFPQEEEISDFPEICLPFENKVMPIDNGKVEFLPDELWTGFNNTSDARPYESKVNNLMRLSKWEKPILSKRTLYRWHQSNKFPGLFVKLSSAVFIDMEVLEKLIEAGRRR